jgi:hypothetical protein
MDKDDNNQSGYFHLELNFEAEEILSYENTK